MANSVDPEQTALIGAVCSESTLFASIRNSSEMLGNYLQQTVSRLQQRTFSDAFFLGALRVSNKIASLDWTFFKAQYLHKIACAY